MRVRKPDIWDVIARGDVVELRTYFRDGKSANRVDRYKNTLLHYAIMKDQPVIVRTLLKETVFVNAKNTNGDTPLHLACEIGNPVVVTSLLKKGAAINMNGFEKRTPLHNAVKEGHPEVVKVLLEHPMINPDLLDSNRCTALHLSAAKGQEHIVTQLLHSDAFDTIKNKDGHTARDMAVFFRMAGVVRLLDEKVETRAQREEEKKSERRDELDRRMKEAAKREFILRRERDRLTDMRLWEENVRTREVQVSQQWERSEAERREKEECRRQLAEEKETKTLERKEREEAERKRKESVARRRLDEQKLEHDERERLKHQRWTEAAKARERGVMSVVEKVTGQPIRNFGILVDDPELGYHSDDDVHYAGRNIEDLSEDDYPWHWGQAKGSSGRPDQLMRSSQNKHVEKPVVKARTPGYTTHSAVDPPPLPTPPMNLHLDPHLRQPSPFPLSWGVGPHPIQQ